MSHQSRYIQIFYNFVAILLIFGSNIILPLNSVRAFEQLQGVKTYQSLIKNLISQNNYEDALVLSERSQGRALTEVTNTSSENKPTNGATSPTIAQIKQTAKQQNATLVQYSILYDNSKESELYIWVIKPTGEIKFSQVDLKTLWQQNTSLTELIKSSREAVGARNKGISTTEIKKSENGQYNKLQTLHKLLIEPVADSLPKNKSDKVIFIPQGALFLLPFAALQDTKGQYLIEKHAISISPSIQLLNLLHSQRQKQVKTQDILIVGNPETASISIKPGEPPQKLSPLPGAEQEAKAIANIFKTTALTGKQASKVAVLKRMTTAKIIHLATSSLNIQESITIPLAPSGNDNGLLTVEEISSLKLNAELVVLSACETGLGKITSDGVIGLERAFIAAGVKSVMSSLWNVSDSSTALLMTEFYKNLQKNPNKTQALQQAMLATKKKYPSPFDWAGFTFTGDTL
jgi:CHAT domain-containing protein